MPYKFSWRYRPAAKTAWHTVALLLMPLHRTRSDPVPTLVANTATSNEVLYVFAKVALAVADVVSLVPHCSPLSVDRSF